MISVITPVYNAERFLAKTIESVLIQEQVSEYLLIDDGSTDGSWEVLKEYSLKDKRVIICKHSDGKNHGRSKTRNVGILKATNELIAFLDADDFYLPNRFDNDLEILSNDSNITGVYNALGAVFHESYKGSTDIKHRLTTFKKRINPDVLFERMTPFGNEGWFSGDAFIVKRDALLSVGMFNEKLIVAEDTELRCKLALKYKLVAGILDKPVGKRTVHDNNVFTNDSIYKKPKLLMYRSLLGWAIANKVKPSRIELIAKKYLSYLNSFSSGNFFTYSKYWISIPLNHPSMFANRYYSSSFMKLIYSIILKRLRK